ncbi:MAG: DNA cytosine methyltransferase [Candidatus Thiodiazotropha sp. (ex Semelilucina semeliformis)]|nr:DNA cytosine methyltransferase [Candidatus Thiodiazotropha sp. (ex Semelilucina semeliformis)]
MPNGAGGGILGGHLLGWKTVCAVERDAYAAGVLAQRQNDGLLPPFPIWSDIQTFDGRLWQGIVDVVSGGFPCQDISVAGTGKGITGSRSGLWKEFARIIGEVRPPYAFIENSPALIVRGFDVVLSDLAACGYDAEWLCLSAAQCGAPHVRDRIWILAYASSNRQQKNPHQKALCKQTNSERRARLTGTVGHARKWPGTRPSGVTPMGMDDGVAFTVDRIKALGNGQVPRVAATAFHTLIRRINHENT